MAPPTLDVVFGSPTAATEAESDLARESGLRVSEPVITTPATPATPSAGSTGVEAGDDAAFGPP
jgi:hypothetical protein